MGYTLKTLDSIRRNVAPTDELLKGTRERRDDSLSAGFAVDGSRRTYNSGSVAHGTANKNLDADGGVVLDRRSYPSLGPDGDNEPPNPVVGEVRALIEAGLRRKYPAVTTTLTKRSIQVCVHEEIEPDCDPTVDVIVALTRKDKQGLWIPHLEDKTWDASNPEEHTRLFTSGPTGLRTVRARVVRLAKAWSVSLDCGAVLSSFNLEALARECITETHDVDDGLAELFRYGAGQIADHNTEDPAGVSEPIKLLQSRDLAVDRLRRAGALMKKALDHDDDERVVREALTVLFPNDIDATDDDSKASMAAAIAQGTQRFGGKLTAATTTGHAVTRTRSYGGLRSDQ